MTNAERLKNLEALVAAYNGDYIFRPSSIDRTINCPGSVRLIAKAPRDRRMPPWIVEGLAMHKVAEQALKGERQVDEWSDRMVRVDDEGLHGTFLDEEMSEGVQFYLDVIEQDMQPDTEAFTEAKLSLSVLDPDDPVLAQNRGTVDRLHIHRGARTIHTLDLKGGKGVMVSAKSPQLRNYSLMAIVNYDVEGGWKEVRNTIVQPRASNQNERLKTVVYDPNDLLNEFLGELHQAMELALEPDPPLAPGTWCRWCNAKTICPALRQQAMHLGDDPFSAAPSFKAGSELGALPPAVFVGTVEEPRPRTSVNGVVLPASTDMDPGEISTVLSKRHLWDIWIKGVEHRAVSLLETGTVIPGWALDRRSGHRRWKDPDKVPDRMREAGLQTSAIYGDPKLKSPAQMEKLLPTIKRGIIEDMVERPLGDVILVSADRARKSEVPASLGPIDPSVRD